MSLLKGMKQQGGVALSFWFFDTPLAFVCMLITPEEVKPDAMQRQLSDASKVRRHYLREALICCLFTSLCLTIFTTLSCLRLFFTLLLATCASAHRGNLDRHNLPVPLSTWL